MLIGFYEVDYDRGVHYEDSSFKTIVADFPVERAWTTRSFLMQSKPPV